MGGDRRAPVGDPAPTGRRAARRGAGRHPRDRREGCRAGAGASARRHPDLPRTAVARRARGAAPGSWDRDRSDDRGPPAARRARAGADLLVPRRRGERRRRPRRGRGRCYHRGVPHVLTCRKNVNRSVLPMIEPKIDDLLATVDSKYTLVILSAKRAREINSYYNQLGEGRGEFVPPLVESGLRNKPLSIALEEIAEGKIDYERPEKIIEVD